MQIRTTQYEVVLIDDPLYTPRSADNVHSYLKEYTVGNRYECSSKYGLTINAENGFHHSCIIFASGGTAGIHENSVTILDNSLFLAIGNSICCLRLPTLEMVWASQVDTVTCFGVYYSPELQCLISHGECEIARINLQGGVEWSVSGKDIFTGCFVLNSNHIEAIDFNLDKYQIDIVDGQIKIAGG